MVDIDELERLHKAAAGTAEGEWYSKSYSYGTATPDTIEYCVEYDGGFGIVEVHSSLDQPESVSTFIAAIKNACDDGLLERLRTAERSVCSGCGNDKTIEEIRAEHPAAFSCCPERNMMNARAWSERARTAEASLAALKAENERLRGLLWYAHHEFNAIRARSGAPLDQHGMTTCGEAWWEKLTKAFASVIGEAAKKPWPSDEARTALETTNDMG